MKLPDLIVVDTNVIVELVAASYGVQPSPFNGPRARHFFRQLNDEHATGIVTPTVYVELVHILVKFWHRAVLKRNSVALLQRYGPLASWVDLYKRDPSILQGMRTVLEHLSQLLSASGLYFLDQDELHPINSKNALDLELIDIMCRYGLDSTDAMILMEAQRIPSLELRHSIMTCCGLKPTSTSTPGSRDDRTHRPRKFEGSASPFS